MIDDNYHRIINISLSLHSVFILEDKKGIGGLASVIEKILERLEAEKNEFIKDIPDGDYLRGNVNFCVCAKEIVQEVAKEYGWVSVKDRLPEVQDEYLVWWTADGFKGKCFYEIVEYHPQEGWIGKIPQAPFGKYTIIAWQALAPYQKGE